MRESIKKEQKIRAFPFFLLISFLSHIFLAFVFLSSESLRNFFNKDKRVIIPSSIRVDMIALPDVQASSPAKKTQKKKRILDQKRKKKKPKKQKKPAKKAEKKTLKEEKTAEKSSASPAQRQEKKTTENRSENKEILKGNKISKGSSSGEETLSAKDMSEINIYLTSVTEKIRAYWNLPKYLTDKNLTAQIEVRINERGEIVYKEIVSSSGNSVFDGRMLQAAESAAPYPPPPASIRRLIQNGIVFDLSSRD